MIAVNQKKSIKLKNRTKYFDPSKDKTHVVFGSPDSYQSRQIKIEGYETRLYWQFRYCDEHDGQTFFYTLTYNDKALPVHYGINCFDYEDLRDLFTGGFRKQLLRKYGTTFKYFVGAELGDGKGERGMHNNPHYHVLFFLEPANNPRFPYVKIDPDEFRHLVKMYWQGFDETRDGFRDYNEAKYGIAKEGEHVGKVADFRACCYCAKYVTKDVKLKKQEDKVLKSVRFSLTQKYKYSEEFYRYFFHEYIMPNFNIPLNPSRTKWAYTEEELVLRLLPFLSSVEVEGFQDGHYMPYVYNIRSKYNLYKDFNEYLQKFIEPKVKEQLSEYRNRYCNKCRISQGVGDYALQFISDKMNPTIQVPSKKGFKNRPISMYYYRKLYTDVIVDKKKSNIRVLNDLGMKYKLNRLQSQIEKKKDQTRNNLILLLSRPDLFDKMKESDVNTEVFYSYNEFFHELNYLLNEEDIEKIYEKYAEYKLVYEDRFFSYQYNGDDSVFSFPDIDVAGDYERFLVPSIYSVSRSDLRLDAFLQDLDKEYLPYISHPYFLRYVGVFRVFDLCSDYFFVQKDDRAQKQAEDIAAVKRFHNQQRVKEFYAAYA